MNFTPDTLAVPGKQGFSQIFRRFIGIFRIPDPSIVILRVNDHSASQKQPLALSFHGRKPGTSQLPPMAYAFPIAGFDDKAHMTHKFIL